MSSKFLFNYNPARVPCSFSICRVRSYVPLCILFILLCVLFILPYVLLCVLFILLYVLLGALLILLCALLCVLFILLYVLLCALLILPYVLLYVLLVLPYALLCVLLILPRVFPAAASSPSRGFIKRCEYHVPQNHAFLFQVDPVCHEEIDNPGDDNGSDQILRSFFHLLILPFFRS